MLAIAKYFAEALAPHVPDDVDFKNLTGASDRYVMYKVGPVLTASVSNGIITTLVNVSYDTVVGLMGKQKSWSYC